MRTSEVLNTAADLIEKRGWAFGSGWPGIDAAAPLCLEGGIAAAVGIKNYFELIDEEVAEFEACPAYRAMQSYLDREDCLLYPWNDDQTSAAPVIEVLRACALVESAREEQDAAWETYAGLVTV